MSNKVMLALSSLLLAAQPLFASGDFIIATNSMPKAAIVVAEDAPVALLPDTEDAETPQVDITS